MKNFTLVILGILFFCVQIYAQNIQDIQYKVFDLTQMYKNTTHTTKMPNQFGIVQGGKYKTASGTIRVPIIFVRFKDDTQSSTYWPSYGSLPSWAANLLDNEVPLDGVFQNLNISNFFNRESGGNNNGIMGNFQMIGDVYYVTTDGNRADYTHDRTVNLEVIQKLDNMGVNFAQYDNWEFMVNNVEYIHNYVPYNQITGEGGDGEIDHIFIYWRDNSLNMSSDIGGYNRIGVEYTTSDGTIIHSWSGSTQLGLLSRGGPWPSRNFPIGSAAHEYGHFLFGTINGNVGSHWDGRTNYNKNYTINTGNISFFALMTEYGGISMCAYEKYRLGWLQPTPIISNTNYAQLYDTHVYNSAFIIPLRYELDENNNSRLVESYFIENYQTTNSYPDANPFKIVHIFNHTINHGVLVYHIENENTDYPTLSDVDIECADGLWDWGLSSGSDTPSDRSDDHLIQTFPNRDNGLDERDYIPLTVGNIFYNDYLALTPASGGEDNPGWRYDSDDWLGDSEDFFKEDYATVFSPWSNPSTIMNNGEQSNFGFEIIDYSQTEHKYVFKFGFDINTVEFFSPAKVENFNANFSGSHPTLTWSANIEPDLLGYRVYKKLYTVDSGTMTDYIFKDSTTTTYTDNWFTIGSGRFSRDNAEYWVVAVDNDNNLSVDTKHYNTNGTSGIQWKIGNNENIMTYKLNQNYPNPFNPSTQIKYEIPKSSFVQLKIYNMLGQEVAQLVNQTQDSGTYEVKFNAKSAGGGLSSGLYIYKLEAGEYSNVKKMLLLK